MSDSYYRDLIARAEIDRENLRAKRMADLQDALSVVLNFEDDVLSPEERTALTAAASAVASLRQTW